MVSGGGSCHVVPITSALLHQPRTKLWKIMLTAVIKLQEELQAFDRNFMLLQFTSMPEQTNCPAASFAGML